MSQKRLNKGVESSPTNDFVRYNTVQNLCLQHPYGCYFFNPPQVDFLTANLPSHSVILRGENKMATDKTKRIEIRITAEEKEKLIEKAQLSNLSVSQYLLALSEERKLVVNEKIPNLLLEITRIGTNINQIAHVANSQKFVTTKQLDEVIKLMGDVSIYMQKILSEIYNSDEHNFKTLERKIDMLIERTEKNGNS